MANCSMKDCEARVVGGFQEFAERKLFDNSKATLLGKKIYWCKKHENGLSILLRSGCYLYDDDLK